MDHAELKRAILQTSLQLGKEFGEDGLTMRAIAQRLGVSATALYQHFDSKGAIMEAIRFSGLEELHRALAPSFEHPEPLERIRGQGVRYLQFARENSWLYGVLMDVSLADLPNDPDEDLEFLMQSTVKFTKALEDGLAAGKCRPDVDVVGAPWMFWAALHGLASLMLRGRPGQSGPALIDGDPDRISREFVDGLVRGFFE